MASIKLNAKILLINNNAPKNKKRRFTNHSMKLKF